MTPEASPAIPLAMTDHRGRRPRTACPFNLGKSDGSRSSRHARRGCGERVGDAPARQLYRELGKAADFAIDCDRAGVLLGYDLEAYRQPKSSPLAGRLRCEERLEQFL